MREACRAAIHALKLLRHRHAARVCKHQIDVRFSYMIVNGVQCTANPSITCALCNSCQRTYKGIRGDIGGDGDPGLPGVMVSFVSKPFFYNQGFFASFV